MDMRKIGYRHTLRSLDYIYAKFKKKYPLWKIFQDKTSIFMKYLFQSMSIFLIPIFPRFIREEKTQRGWLQMKSLISRVL